MSQYKLVRHMSGTKFQQVVVCRIVNAPVHPCDCFCPRLFTVYHTRRFSKHRTKYIFNTLTGYLHVLSHYGLAGPPVYHSTPKPCCYPGALLLKRELCLKKKPNNQTVNLTVVS